MDKFKLFLANKKIGFYLSLFSFLMAFVCLITYLARGGNYLAPISGLAVTMLILGLISNLVALVCDFSILGVLPMLFYAITFAAFFNGEMQFLTNVLFGVDGNVLDGGWFTFIITVVLALISSAVAFSIGLSKSNKLLAEEK